MTPRSRNREVPYLLAGLGKRLGDRTDERTGIDQLLRIDWVAVRFKDLCLEVSDGVFAVSVDLGANRTTTWQCAGHPPGTPFVATFLSLSSLWARSKHDSA